MESKHPAFWMGHTFSLVTGGAFVASAALNALTFWLTWNLNYFLIASPADVIMSGFILVSMLLIVSGVVAVFSWGVLAFKRKFESEADKAVQRRQFAILQIDKNLAALAMRLRASGLSDEEVEDLLGARRMNLLKQEEDHDTMWSRRTRFALTIGISFIVPLVVTTVDAFGTSARGFDIRDLKPFWYETGLKVSTDYTAFGGNCGDAPVAWLGSSAAILECKDRVRVIHKLDDLVTVRRYDR